MILASTFVSARSPHADNPDPGRGRKRPDPRLGSRTARTSIPLAAGKIDATIARRQTTDFRLKTIGEPSPELDALARETIGAAIEAHRA